MLTFLAFGNGVAGSLMHGSPDVYLEAGWSKRTHDEQNQNKLISQVQPG